MFVDMHSLLARQQTFGNFQINSLLTGLCSRQSHEFLVKNGFPPDNEANSISKQLQNNDPHCHSKEKLGIIPQD